MIGNIFTCENIAHIEFFLQVLLPKIFAIYMINNNNILEVWFPFDEYYGETALSAVAIGNQYRT